MKSIRYDQHYKYQHILVLCYEQLSGIIDGKSHHINYQHFGHAAQWNIAGGTTPTTAI
ncbi:MAG: hypothetical protein IPJ13_25515 [Saprospiraceae bacterium]|nr:hypothetical protein [Saprospiraceae bacterium]